MSSPTVDSEFRPEIVLFVIIVHRCGQTGIASIFQREMCGAQFGYGIYRHKKKKKKQNRGRINECFLVEILNERIDVARALTLGHNFSSFRSFPVRIASDSHSSNDHARLRAILSYAMCDEICKRMMETMV